MVNWFTIIIIISILAAIGIFCFLIYMINKKKPALIRKSLVLEQKNEIDTTFNWDTILAIVIASTTFGAGIFTILGVLVFIFYKELYLDGSSIGIMTIVFMVFVGQELDKFLSRYLKK